MSSLHIEIDDKTGKARFKYDGDPILIARAIMDLVKFDDEFGVALNVVYIARNEQHKCDNAFNQLVEMINSKTTNQ